MLVSMIYQSVTLRAASEWTLNVLDVDSFFLHHGSDHASQYLAHVRKLKVESPINLARFNRCAYYSIFRITGLPSSSSRTGSPGDLLAHAQFLSDIADQLQRIMVYVPRDSLHTFQ